MSNSLVIPVLALAAWSMVIWAWMLVTRVPEILRMRMKLDPTLPRGEQMSLLPAKIRWKADNYNHLMEQPTVFYAVALALHVSGLSGGLNTTLAWIYVCLRVIHSVYQATINVIQVRFALFVFSSLVLVGLLLNGLRSVLTMPQ